MRSSARPLYLAFATSTLLFGASAAADEPKEPLPSVPVAPPGVLPQAAPVTPDRIAEALAPQPGGLTPNEAARIALRTRPSLRAKEAELRAATARVDQALTNFLPRVTVTGTYTRLSLVENKLGGGGTTLIGVKPDPNDPFNQDKATKAPLAPGLIEVNPCQLPSGFCAQDSSGAFVTAVPVQGITLPALQNSYSFVASVAVPISDYVLRISQGYAASSHAESAKKIELEAEGLNIAADAKIAFYNWVRTKATAAVTAEAVAQADAHLKDVQRAFEVGLSSKGDVLRLEAQLASAQQTQADAAALASLVEEQLRIALGLPAGKPLGIGIDVLHEPAEPSSVTLSTLQDEALAKRLEIRALDETEYSLKKTVSLTRAGYFPRVDAFADVQYSNPNQRVFASGAEFRMTWDAGVRLSWTINDSITAAPAVTEAKARVEQIAAQKEALQQGLKLEVASAYAELKRAEANIEAAERGLAAAEESLRVQTELIRAGRATGVSLVDAEAEVTRARLRRVDVRVGILVAKTRLEHATGRDVQQKQ